MTTRTSTQRIGWYGKVPSLGDFVRQGLPDVFVDYWDGWLQRAMVAGRRAQGAAFEAALQGFPTWRFVLAPGLAGPSGWCGVMQASGDRVGRTFPFTLAQPLAMRDAVTGQPQLDTAWLEDRLDQLAQTAVSALDQQSLERFERLVGDLPMPESMQVPMQVPMQVRMQAPSDPGPGDDGEAGQEDWFEALILHGHAVLPVTGRVERILRHCGGQRLATRIAGCGFWWIPPSAEDDGAALLMADPLPEDGLLGLLKSAG